ncbi:MAG: Bax inhibitor-1/YccA family protein [Cyanobacteria bacterium SIG26]|nr:Bax inhibitor-1/YccA family protein [Cyanobacteria bacterium SIG26]
MANPTLNERVLRSPLEFGLDTGIMSINGTILKTCFLGLLMMLTFGYNWSLIIAGYADKAIMLSKIGFWAGLVLVFVIAFAPKNKFLTITTSLYALCEGLILGYLSALANTYYPGVASQAAIGTFFALFGMFILYKSGLVKCNDKFRMVIYNSTFAIFGIYLVQIVLNLFNISIPFIFSNSPIGIAFSVIVVAIASFNLIIDFDMIERFSSQLPKHYEWYCGFSLLVTLIWMYIEILNLLMKFHSRD